MRAAVPTPATAAQLTLQDTWLFGGTIRDADLILVMEAGQIVEQSSHAELLAAGGPTRGWRISIVRLSSKSLLSCVRKGGITADADAPSASYLTSGWGVREFDGHRCHLCAGSSNAGTPPGQRRAGRPPLRRLRECAAVGRFGRHCGSVEPSATAGRPGETDPTRKGALTRHSESGQLPGAGAGGVAASVTGDGEATFRSTGVRTWSWVDQGCG